MARAILVLFFAQFLWLAGPGATQSPWLVAYGTGGCASDFVPTLHTGGEMPALGNANFKLVSENLTGGAPGFFLLSSAAVDLPFFGRRLYVAPDLRLVLGSQATGTNGTPGAGAATLSLPVPSQASLVGLKFFVQGIFIDRVYPLSIVLHTTHGLEVTIARSIALERAVIRDRLQYQAHFAGVNQAQADTLGRAIWAANQVGGYSYVRTEQFTCGGESHWMVIVLHTQTGLEFHLIPGGSFRMGDIHGTGYSTELPVRWVRIEPFLMARTELVQSVWQPVMGFNPSGFQGPALPVEMLVRPEAQQFCARTGLRLPSEAEWEYACRAGVDNCYHFGLNYVYPGPSSLGLYAWYDANGGGATHPVGQKLPNAFGLYDMLGNVGEFVEDDMSRTRDYTCVPPDGRAWFETPSISIERGFGASSALHTCRSASRSLTYPIRSAFRGFRPAASLSR